MPAGGPEFLDGHIAKWRERSVHDRCGTRPLSLPKRRGYKTKWRSYGYETESAVFMHYMRSFIVDLSEDATTTEPYIPGLRCLRDHITFKGFYEKTKTTLIEKRYSTALSLLPLEKPAGHYVLVSICDGQDDDVNNMFDQSPGGNAYDRYRATPWKKYGIYPAGLYTGISMFQLQICALIDLWEKDWASTIKHIDEMVSLNVSLLPVLF